MVDLTREELAKLAADAEQANQDAALCERYWLPPAAVLALIAEVVKSRIQVRDLTWENNKLSADNARLYHQLKGHFETQADLRHMGVPTPPFPDDKR